MPSKLIQQKVKNIFILFIHQRTTRRAVAIMGLPAGHTELHGTESRVSSDVLLQATRHSSNFCPLQHKPRDLVRVPLPHVLLHEDHVLQASRSQLLRPGEHLLSWQKTDPDRNITETTSVKTFILKSSLLVNDVKFFCMNTLKLSIIPELFHSFIKSLASFFSISILDSMLTACATV